MKSDKKLFLHYINRDFQYLCVRIRNHFYGTGKNLDTDSVHDLRVEIKRLRAFYKLVEALTPDFSFGKNFKPVQRLFKAAAPLRDIQVQRVLTAEWEDRLSLNFDSYKKILHQQEEASKTELVVFLKNWDLKKLTKKKKKIRKTLAEMRTDIAQAKANTHLQSLFKQMTATRAASGEDPKKLHTLRTQTKQMRYTLDILRGCLPKIQYPASTAGLLKQVHHFLGLWHDREISLEFLKNFRANNETNQETNQTLLPQLEEAIREEQQKLLQGYELAWQRLIQQIGMP